MSGRHGSYADAHLPKPPPTAPVAAGAGAGAGGLTESLAAFLHERFAPDWAPHWSDLDDFERRESQYFDMAKAVVEEGWLDAAGLAARAVGGAGAGDDAQQAREEER